MIETIEITTPDDAPQLFVAVFQEHSKISVYGQGGTPAVALLDLMELLRKQYMLLVERRSQLEHGLLEELTAIEAYFKTFTTEKPNEQRDERVSAVPTR